jgi:hypothetical protein
MRNEFKYLVPNELLGDLRKSIGNFADEDPNSPLENLHHEYTVRSIYFDTTRFEYYFDKRQGIKSRKKIRIRSYNQIKDHPQRNPFVFLEVKRKEIDFIWKSRCKVQWSNLENLLETGDIESYVIDNDNQIINQEASRFLFHYKGKNLKPVVLVVYEREAYFSKFDPHFRISLDKNIRSLAFPKISELFASKGLEVSFHQDFVLELKFSGAFPAWMSDLLFKYRLTRQAVSKYKFALDHHKIFRASERIKVFGMH